MTSNCSIKFKLLEDTDFWNELSEPQRQEIKNGLAELEAGQKHDYESVVAKYR